MTKITHEGNGLGYSRVRYDKCGEEDGSAYIHRLIAVAQGELSTEDFLAGKRNVHHLSQVPFDNRPSNLEVQNRYEHSEHHSDGHTRPTGEEARRAGVVSD